MKFRIIEGVLSPELTDIKEIILSIPLYKYNTFEEYNHNLNKYLNPYKIYFEITGNKGIDPDDYLTLINGEYRGYNIGESYYDDIIVFFAKILNTMYKKRKIDEDEFKKQIISSIEHEFVHHMQAEKSGVRGDITKKQENNNQLEYLSKKTELMAYAREIIEELKNKKLSKEKIFDFIKKSPDQNLFHAYLGERPSKYFDRLSLVIKQNPIAYKQFLKYLFQYADQIEEKNEKNIR